MVEEKMIIQEKGQTFIKVFAAVRKDSHDGKLMVVWRTCNEDLSLTKMLTEEYRKEYPPAWEENETPLVGYCRLEITAEMLPFDK